MASISSISASLPSVNVLVEQFLSVERKPIQNYNKEKTSLTQQLATLTDLKTEITNLNTRFESFTTTGTSNTLDAKSAVSSNESLFTVAADTTAVTGIYSIKIEQIARNDTAVSDQYSAAGKNLSAQFKNKALTFRMGTGSADLKTFSIDLTGAEETNEDVLRKIARDINSAGIGISASVIKDTPDTVRMIIGSNEAGSTNALALDDNGSAKLFQTLGFIKANNDRPEMSKSGGGFVIADAGDLNAKFSINGISIVADSNTITDVLKGVTISLRKAQEADAASETISISGSSEDLLEQVNKFIEDYNKLITFITEKSRIDPATGTRGAFAGNFTLRNLMTDLRTLNSGSVASVKSGNPRSLQEIGIAMKNDGTLEVQDSDKLKSIIESGAEKVTDLFNSESGIAVRGKDLLKSFISTGGGIDSLKKGVQSRITGIESNISRMESRLKIKENTLRVKFSDLQRTLSRLNTQTALLSRIFGTLSQTGTYGSFQSSLF